MTYKNENNTVNTVRNSKHSDNGKENDDTGNIADDNHVIAKQGFIRDLQFNMCITY